MSMTVCTPSTQSALSFAGLASSASHWARRQEQDLRHSAMQPPSRLGRGRLLSFSKRCSISRALPKAVEAPVTVAWGWEQGWEVWSQTSHCFLGGKQGWWWALPGRWGWVRTQFSPARACTTIQKIMGLHNGRACAGLIFLPMPPVCTESRIPVSGGCPRPGPGWLLHGSGPAHAPHPAGHTHLPASLPPCTAWAQSYGDG